MMIKIIIRMILLSILTNKKGIMNDLIIINKVFKFDYENYPHLDNISLRSSEAYKL